MESSIYWKNYKGKNVRLIIEDGKYPRPKDGLLIDYDDTHIFLQINDTEPPKPFGRLSIKRVDLR